MQYSIIHFSKINLGNRIDAEYFQPTYLNIENLLFKKQAKQLKLYCSITGSAFYPAATHLYQAGDIPFIRCVDCIQYPIVTKQQHDTFEKIPKHFADKHKNIKRLSQGDIVITKVGSPCYASVIHDINDVALSRTVLGLKNILNINPYYLVAFLRSKYGFKQLFRERELTIQYQLTLDRVGNIFIFRPENRLLELAIANCFLLHEELQKKSITLYQQAETFLLSELGLTDWQPKRQLSFVKNFSDTQDAERIDAEYFQPKYEEIIEAVQNYKGGYESLENLLLRIETGEYSPKYQKRERNLKFYVRSLNIKEGLIEIDDNYFVNPANFTKLLKAGDIITPRVGTLGVFAMATDDLNGAVYSDNILCFRLPKNFDSHVYAAYLNLGINKLLIQRLSRGSVQERLNQETLKSLIIPVFPFEAQEKIKQKIIESQSTKHLSKSLLEIAKRGVEIAIEQNEEDAEKWINSELEKAGVDLE